MKPMDAPSVPPLSRRRFLLNGAALTTAVLTPGILGLTSGAAGETPMDMSSGARGVPRAPYDKDARSSSRRSAARRTGNCERPCARPTPIRIWAAIGCRSEL